MSTKRILGLIFCYLVTCAAWLVLGVTTAERTSSQRYTLRDQVSSLWGEPQAQQAPQLRFRAVQPSVREVSASVVVSDEEVELLGLSFPEASPEATVDSEGTIKPSPEQKRWVVHGGPEPVALSSTDVEASLRSDPRRKGLLWYALYDVGFSGEYTYEHTRLDAGYLDVELWLPTHSALYDRLVFEVNGEDRRAGLDPATGVFRVSVPVRPGDTVRFRAGYDSRGSELWTYTPGSGVQQLSSFSLALHTDFEDIDFPAQTLSPTQKTPSGKGWDLRWDFESTITGRGMGMVLPKHIQPGELSTAMTLFAPVSLLFFFIMLFVLATLRKLDIHPINYLFLGGAFFAFHLLFSYSADHLSVPWAFAISSVVSMGLVASYLRLVVSPKFALREAAIGQLVYLIGFSLAHFWEGFTGLTITILAIITLFLLMQATGRLRWSEVFASSNAAPPVVPAAQPASVLRT